MFYFSTQANKNKFKDSPEKFLPQYGGYAIADKGKKVSIDPETFEVKDGKVYLFYNSYGTNTLDLWNQENPETLRKKADENWLEITKR